jgi:hypothetical protein
MIKRSVELGQRLPVSGSRRNVRQQVVRRVDGANAETFQQAKESKFLFSVRTPLDVENARSSREDPADRAKKKKPQAKLLEAARSFRHLRSGVTP